MKAPRLSALAISGAAIASAFTLNWATTHQPAVAAQEAPAPAVPVAEVVVRSLAPTARFTGHLEASHVVDITPRIEGFLASASVPEGGRVTKGEPLFRIDPEPFKLKVAQARAELERALALAEQASSDHARLSSLSGSGAVSRKALDEAKAAKGSREADVAAARAALDEAELLLSYTEIRAPISGVADRVRIQPGNQVAAGPGNVLTRIVATDELFVTFHIDETNFARLGAAGLSNLEVQVEVAAEPGETRRGKLDFSSAEFDRATGTLRARAVIDNRDGRLRPGMFVRVSVPLEAASDAVLVTESAIGTAPGGRYVLVVDANDTIQQKSVELGASEGQLRVIADGLSPGERVVLKGLVRPGMAVDPMLVAMPGVTLESEGEES